MDRAELVELYRAHADRMVLSVYLDADQRDFAERDKWRVVFRNALKDAASGADDTAAFEAAASHLRAALDSFGDGFLPGRGWVGFATTEELVLAAGVPVPMPDLVRWERGLRVAPYARALKQARPVVAALVDSRHARVLRYQDGALTDRDRLHADTHLGDLTDVNVQKRATSVSGVRGETATDAAQRFLRVERDRLLARVAEEIRAEAGADGVVVLGGPARAVAALERELDGLAADRVRHRPELSFDLSDAEIRGVVESAASELSEIRHRSLVDRIVDAARSGGEGCLGEADTERALREKRVRALIVADAFRRAQPDRADHYEGTAFEQGADVVEVSRGSADVLQESGGGVGAVLRYRAS